MSGSAIESFETSDTAIERLRETIADAEEQLLLTTPVEHLDELEDELAEAIDRDIPVLLLLGGDYPTDEERLGSIGAVVRGWRTGSSMQTVCVAESGTCTCVPYAVFEDDREEAYGITFQNDLIESFIFSMVCGNLWSMGPEIHVAEPNELPETYRNFTSAMVQTTLHLEAGHTIKIEANARRIRDGDLETVEGQVSTVRQNFVSPATNSFPSEHMVFLDTGDDLVTVGGPHAFAEDYAATEMTLRHID